MGHEQQQVNRYIGNAWIGMHLQLAINATSYEQQPENLLNRQVAQQPQLHSYRDVAPSRLQGIANPLVGDCWIELKRLTDDDLRKDMK